jgi:hypothetical protein
MHEKVRRQAILKHVESCVTDAARVSSTLDGVTATLEGTVVRTTGPDLRKCSVLAFAKRFGVVD